MLYYQGIFLTIVHLSETFTAMKQGQETIFISPTYGQNTLYYKDLKQDNDLSEYVKTSDIQ